MCSSEEDQDGSRSDGGSEFGGFRLPSVVQGFLGVFSGVESGLRWEEDWKSHSERMILDTRLARIKRCEASKIELRP